MRHFFLIAAMMFATAAHAQVGTDNDHIFATPGGEVVTIGLGMQLNAAGKVVPVTQTDPCQSVNNAKSSVAVNITSATTTQLVALSGTTSIYVCGGVLTIAPSGTSADTAQLVYGTGSACATNPIALTGAFGAGDITTAAPPIVVPFVSSGVFAVAPSGKALCLTSAGTTVNIQGVISYVQQ